ncbi:hypothetical protein FORC2_2467 [Yersinia enterocolitica]|nr:hypothetical protein FORC2_2467 [Yersinia enterocolitica]
MGLYSINYSRFHYRFNDSFMGLKGFTAINIGALVIAFFRFVTKVTAGSRVCCKFTTWAMHHIYLRNCIFSNYADLITSIRICEININ